ncbi:S1 family peptidase [Fodinibius halophilus]|uniref:Trypsin-like peptidase domain-containing protein n=1 Tax=Fodinibius halophilus TaxID=1736908 RepID=A0A6M1TG81_9BACT|nr:serine protease [Fodinibius halophilus]NGP89804.1 trypsin-like peptidase domain-containing protein [Fodinibius halophilus]
MLFSSNNQDSTATKHYTTSFPTYDISKHIEDARSSILRILSTSFYDTYTFDEAYLTLDDIKTNTPKELADAHYSSEESTAGTGIVLENAFSNSLIITCQHVVSSPDTVISYFEGSDIPEETFVKSISIKHKQNNLLFTKNRIYSFNIIAANENHDIALLSVDIREDEKLPHPPIQFGLGDSDDLKMGSFLYVLGFPSGYPMITRGITSTRPKKNKHFFLTDALFNPGISGGLVLASKNNFHDFKWVGMARSATASEENILVPRTFNKDYSKLAKPYADQAFVQKKVRISYGITQAIPINTIKDFIENHQQQITENGFRYSIRD